MKETTNLYFKNLNIIIILDHLDTFHHPDWILLLMAGKGLFSILFELKNLNVECSDEESEGVFD
jgi:hypothetical protein